MLKKRMLWPMALVLAAVAALLLASAVAAKGAATITISHQMRGCHSWQFNGGALKPSLSVTMKAGTVLTFVNNDIMPHKLIQTAGPKLRLARANMNHLSASTSVTLARKGLYRFSTKAGEDYKGIAMKTIGEDHVLHLSVLVK
jgi:plastocyanin